MIRDLAIAFLAVLGLGAFAALIALIVAYRRVKPEFPPLDPVQRDP